MKGSAFYAGVIPLRQIRLWLASHPSAFSPRSWHLPQIWLKYRPSPQCQSDTQNSLWMILSLFDSLIKCTQFCTIQRYSVCQTSTSGCEKCFERLHEDRIATMQMFSDGTCLYHSTMYYRSGTGVRCCIEARQILHVHSPGRSTLLRETMSWPPSWKCDVKSKILIYAYLCEEHSCQIAPRADLKRRMSLRLFWRGHNKKKKKNKTKKMSSDMKSVPDLKRTLLQ